MKKKTALLFVSWAQSCSRSDGIAARLGGESHMVYSPFWGSHPATILFKYISQSIKTLWLLFRKRPQTVYIMTPPVVTCFAVWFYALVAQARFIIDAHTGALLDPRWKKVMFLHRFFSRCALTTIVTNRYLSGIVESWKANATIVPDVPVEFAKASDLALRGACKMTFVSTFAADEPFEIFLEAARATPDVHYYVTGNHKEADPDLLAKRPDNVELTGFLSDADYVALLKGSDAMICLTTLDHTMQRGAYEAIYLSRPVIVSSFGVLREAFPKGSVHVENTATDIARGVLQMRERLPEYEREARELRDTKLARWEESAAALRALMARPGRANAPTGDV